MTLYTDEDPAESSAMCISTEDGGESLCGQYNCHNEITKEHVESVWALFRDDRIHTGCDCREELMDLLGIEDEDELDTRLRRRRARRVLRERQEAHR
ncbi:hypothetical protein M197_gp06 [Haloarcula hispanica tailed virus 2]|uniref:Uncharacterized protein n=1 Tax=Haloarcula hispanica tailed virus 2 TaxID=1273751 RepID=R4TLY3_9CAUD|nr:hypothetical protein M197_gp06 [Haloarcula hispanica tailed virus 2]AGM11173.1 hypothetical protein HHTV2_6 [Haloarcula hispanica tailed virus 2]